MGLTGLGLGLRGLGTKGLGLGLDNLEILGNSQIDDVLTEHGGLLHVLPLAVHLRFFLLAMAIFIFFMGPLLHA